MGSGCSHRVTCKWKSNSCRERSRNCSVVVCLTERHVLFHVAWLPIIYSDYLLFVNVLTISRSFSAAVSLSFTGHPVTGQRRVSTLFISSVTLHAPPTSTSYTAIHLFGYFCCFSHPYSNVNRPQKADSSQIVERLYNQIGFGLWTPVLLSPRVTQGSEWNSFRRSINLLSSFHWEFLFIYIRQ